MPAARSRSRRNLERTGGGGFAGARAEKCPPIERGLRDPRRAERLALVPAGGSICPLCELASCDSRSTSAYLSALRATLSSTLLDDWWTRWDTRSIVRAPGIVLRSRRGAVLAMVPSPAVTCADDGRARGTMPLVFAWCAGAEAGRPRPYGLVRSADPALGTGTHLSVGVLSVHRSHNTMISPYFNRSVASSRLK